MVKDTPPIEKIESFLGGSIPMGGLDSSSDSLPV
nr:MAG TPA: hypothetical protein [Caudoviricetes sp.]